MLSINNHGNNLGHILAMCSRIAFIFALAAVGVDNGNSYHPTNLS